MNETIDTIIAWNKQTFPDTTLKGQIDKYFKEESELLTAKEFGTAEEIINEMADCFIVACGIGRFDIVYAARFMGRVFEMFTGDARFTRSIIQDAVNKKMAVNRNREWKFNGDNYQHVDE